MKSFLLNENGDIEFNTMHNIKMIEGIEEIKQRLRNSLITEKEEWFLNQSFGVPWLKLLENGDQPAAFRKEVLKVLNNEPAVDEIISVKTSFDRANRALNIDFSVRVGGETVTESVVIE